jgi:His/Glu/Gln/Arg/opine family amino acid ABC transporter permease subunit
LKAGGEDFPWWLVAVAAIGLWLGWLILSDATQAQVFAVVVSGLGVTVFVTLVAFVLAALLGLLLALAALSDWLAVRQVARFYVEVMRGLPVFVLLLYVAFVGGPALVGGVNLVLVPLGFEPLLTRDLSFLWRAVIALVLGYGAFLAEVFRAGILAVDAGQVEAAKALGLSRWLRFRLIVFPQAIRTILPPLGNDFIAMVKDSSLVSTLGVADITQNGKVYAAGSFRYFETYNIIAFIYLALVIGLSLALRALERRLRGRATR